MNTKSDAKNEFLRRREVTVEVEASKTPTFAEMETEMAGEMKSDKGLVAVKSIRGTFGSNKFTVKAFIYSKAEDKARFEPKVKAKKGAEAQAAAPAAAEAKK